MQVTMNIFNNFYLKGNCSWAGDVHVHSAKDPGFGDDLSGQQEGGLCGRVGRLGRG